MQTRRSETVFCDKNVLTDGAHEVAPAQVSDTAKRKLANDNGVILTVHCNCVCPFHGSPPNDLKATCAARRQ